MQYHNVDVQVVATKSSLAFYSHRDLQHEIQTKGVKIWQDEDEWKVSVVMLCGEGQAR